jgi:hypothetical protein
MEFKQMYLGTFEQDPRLETLIQSFLVYHRAADEIDGHIVYPVTKEERATCRKAFLAGQKAQEEYLQGLNIVVQIGSDEWNNAKKTALRLWLTEKPNRF